jgi:hypothetical protein
MASQTLPTPTASVELLNNNDGVTLHPDHNASHNITYPAPHHASSKPSGGTSGSYWDSEDDSDMSEHAGGVALDDSWAGMTMAHAQQLNAEMDVIDAEVMGPYNVAAVAMTSSIQTHSNNPYEDDSTFSGPDDEMLDVQQLAWFADSMFEEGDGSGPYGAASVDHPSAMAQLSQHLPILQDGQAQGNLAQTTNFQGVHINSITPSSSGPFPFPCGSSTLRSSEGSWGDGSSAAPFQTSWPDHTLPLSLLFHLIFRLLYLHFMVLQRSTRSLIP